MNVQWKESEAGRSQRLAHQPEIGNQRALKGVGLQIVSRPTADVRKQEEAQFLRKFFRALGTSSPPQRLI